MRDPAEPAAEDALPLPPRPDAEVLVPRLRPADLRRELLRLGSEHERAQRELGALVVSMSHDGALDPVRLADRSAALRSLEQQIGVLETALGSRARATLPASARRATMLAALLAVAVLGAVAGAWIQRDRSDPAAAPITVPTVVTQTLTSPPETVTVQARTTQAARTTASATHGGRATSPGP